MSFSKFFFCLYPGTSCILIAASLLLALISIHISFFSILPFMSFFFCPIRRRFIKCSTLGKLYLILINMSTININTRRIKKYGSIDSIRGTIHLKKKYSELVSLLRFLHTLARCMRVSIRVFSDSAPSRYEILISNFPRSLRIHPAYTRTRFLKRIVSITSQVIVRTC